MELETDEFTIIVWIKKFIQTDFADLKYNVSIFYTILTFAE